MTETRETETEPVDIWEIMRLSEAVQVAQAELRIAQDILRDTWAQWRRETAGPG